jgi:uncharacterized membrane protein YciS (DUF1049 family)
VDTSAILAAATGPGGVVVLAVILAFGFYKGWWVPGFIYTETRDRAAKLDDQVDRFSQALEHLTDEIRDGRRAGHDP